MVLLTNAQEEERGKDGFDTNDVIRGPIRGGGSMRMPPEGIMYFGGTMSEDIIPQSDEQTLIRMRKVFVETLLWETYEFGAGEENNQDSSKEFIEEGTTIRMEEEKLVEDKNEEENQDQEENEEEDQNEDQSLARIERSRSVQG